jgi:RNA polymerase sigma-70 factor (family 1)
MKENFEKTALLTRLQNGDKEAFAQLYILYSKQLYLNILRMVKAEEIAEELLQDIFVLIWEKRQMINIQQSFRSYLFRISENKVVDLFRSFNKDKKLYAQMQRTALEQYNNIEEELLASENIEFIKKAINTLPPQRKLIFELCKLQGKSYNEVSKLLGVSPSTINDHIVKATKSIKDFFSANRHYSASIVLFMIIDKL